MTIRKLALLWVCVLGLIVGSYVVVARRSGPTPVNTDELSSAPTLAASGSMNTDAQIAFWRARIDQTPQDFVSLTYLGQTFLRKARETGDVADYVRAQTALQKAADLDPDYEFALASLAAAQFSTHDFQHALELGQRVYAADPEAIQALATVGDAQLELGNYDAATSAYAELADRSPSAPVFSRKARLAWVHGQTDQALQLMQQAADDASSGNAPSENAAWYECQLGELNFGLGRLEDAETHYRAALQEYPDYYLALAGLAKTVAAHGQYADAIALYQRAVAIIPQPEFLANLGDLYALTNRSEDAEKQYATVEFIGKLAEINHVVYNRQLVLFSANHDRNVPDALAMANAELAGRKDIYGYDAEAWALYKNGRFSQALTSMREAMKLGTRDALLYYHAGLISAALGDNGRARSLLNEALSINSQFDPLQARVARATLEGLGNP